MAAISAPALLLRLAPLNHPSCRRAKGYNSATWAVVQRQDSCRRTQWKLKGWSCSTAPVSTRLISSSDARESVSYEDIMFALWPQCLISRHLFVSHESGTCVDDHLCVIVIFHLKSAKHSPPVSSGGGCKEFENGLSCSRPGFTMVAVVTQLHDPGSIVARTRFKSCTQYIDCTV